MNHFSTYYLTGRNFWLQFEGDHAIGLQQKLFLQLHIRVYSSNRFQYWGWIVHLHVISFIWYLQFVLNNSLYYKPFKLVMLKLPHRKKFLTLNLRNIISSLFRLLRYFTRKYLCMSFMWIIIYISFYLCKCPINAIARKIYNDFV